MINTANLSVKARQAQQDVEFQQHQDSPTEGPVVPAS